MRYAIKDSELVQGLFEGDILHRISLKIDYSRIHSSNKELYDYLKAQKDMELWTKEDFAKLTGMKLKRKEPKVIATRSLNFFTMYPNIIDQDITSRLPEDQKKYILNKCNEVRSEFIADCEPYVMKWMYVGLINIRPVVAVTDYGVVSIHINPFNSISRNKFKQSISIAIEQTVYDFFKSYKGNHKLSNIYMTGNQRSIDVIQFRNL